AAGIGALTIIKDVVAGVVMLFEDIVAVGDWVDLEYAEGTVESINLRATQVRGIDGVLWTVRNGEIIRVGNYARGFSTAVVVLDIDAEGTTSWSPRSWRRSPANSPRTRSGARPCSPPPR